MLKYLKRQKSRRRSRENDDTNNDNSNIGRSTNINANVSDKQNSLRSTSSFCDEIFFEELTAIETEEDDAISCGASSLKSVSSTLGVAANCLNEDIFKYHSRLSMCLQSIVNEPNCLSYFVQFLETKNALALIKFFLDVENFKAAAKSQNLKEQNTRRQSMDITAVADKLEPQPTDALNKSEVYSLWNSYGAQTTCDSNNFNDSNACDARQRGNTDANINNVPELKTLCDLSMRKPITDDEKSQICAETNKQLTKCSNNNKGSYKSNYNTVSNNLKDSKVRATSEISLLSNTSTNTNNEPCAANSAISAASLNDAMAIYQKYLNANSVQYIGLPVAILEQISLILCKSSVDKVGCIENFSGEQQQHYSNHITTSCFDEAQAYVLNELETKFLNEFLQSSYYARYCVELIENSTINSRSQDNLNIFDILYSEVTLFFFMEFLEQHGERECLDFWTTAINFRKSFLSESKIASKETEIETQANAMQIYDKFFSLQSEQRLWSSDRLRSWVEEHICEPGKVAQSFDLPLEVVAKYLERKYLSKFLNTQLFENYVNELKSKVNAEQQEPNTYGNNETIAEKVATSAISGFHKFSIRRASSIPNENSRHRKTLSDCSQENTRDLLKNIVGTPNTLLSMMDPVHKQSKNTCSNLQIDSSQLNNPNLLWQRAHNTDRGLTFGRVNSLGRYERDFDACHDYTYGFGVSGKHGNWSLSVGGNKLKNAVRKLVNLPEAKMQEEIAWQVAEMIVKDVTSVTLQNSDNSKAKNRKLPAMKTL